MANITTQTIRVDLSTGKVIPTAYTHQNDTARTLVFDVYNGGMPYAMTGNTVKFAYKSPIVNGQYSVIAGASMESGTVSGNKVSVTLPVAYTQISGVGMLTMIITPTSGTVRPVNIRLVVQKSADGDDEIAGASDFPTTLQQIADNWYDENIANWLNENIESVYDAEAFGTAIDSWLDDHPEATTTVEDGSITYAKLNSNINSGFVLDNGTYKYDYNGLVNKPESDDTLSVEGGFADAKAVGDAVRDEASARASADTELSGDISDLNTALSQEASARANEIAVERARIDSFTQLSSGSTTGDAELIDARVGADGVTYTNLGEAVRTQFGNVQQFQTINPTGWMRAAITSATGAITRNWNNNRAFLQGGVPDNVVKIDILENISAVLLAYSDTEYIGAWKGNGFAKAFHTALTFDMAKIRSLYPDYHYYLLVYSSPTDAHTKVQFTVRNDIQIQDKSIYTSDSYSAMANVAESYFKVAFDENDEFGYDNLFGLYCTNAEDDGVKKINCSQFVYALLTGTYYNDSRYVKSENIPSIWGWQSDGTGTAYKPTGYIYEDFMYSQHMAKYFADKGLLVEYDPDHHYISKGDLVFIGDPAEYPDRHYNVYHVAIVFNVIDNTHIVTLDGGGGMTRTVDGQSVAIGLKTINLSASGQRYFFVKNQLPNITVKHELVAESYSFLDRFSISAGSATSMGVVADLDCGIYTAVIETDSENDPLIEERLYVYYADGNYDSFSSIGSSNRKVIPFFVQKKGLACPLLKNNHDDSQTPRISRVRIYKGAVAYLDD